jgi:hypothetical protein
MSERGRTETAVVHELRTPQAAGIAGLAFAALFVVSLLLVRDHPGPGSSAAEVEEWYLRDAARHIALVGIYLAPFAGIAFLWFIAVIRDRIGEREDRFFATVFFGSGLLFVAMLFAAAAAAGAPLAAVRFQDAPAPDPGTVGLARALAFTLLYVYGVKAGAVFILVVSTVALRTRALPHWLVLGGYAIAVVLLLSVSFFQAMVLLFPCWVAVVSIVILREAMRGDRGAIPGAAA